MNPYQAETVCIANTPYAAFHDNTVPRRTLCEGLSAVKICRSAVDLAGYEQRMSQTEQRTFIHVDNNENRYRQPHANLMVEFTNWMNQPTDRMLDCGAFAIIRGPRVARFYLEFACQVMMYAHLRRYVLVVLYDPENISIPGFFRSFFLRHYINEMHSCSVSILNTYIRSVVAMFRQNVQIRDRDVNFQVPTARRQRRQYNVETRRTDNDQSRENSGRSTTDNMDPDNANGTDSQFNERTNPIRLGGKIYPILEAAANAAVPTKTKTGSDPDGSGTDSTTLTDHTDGESDEQTDRAHIGIFAPAKAAAEAALKIPKPQSPWKRVSTALTGSQSNSTQPNNKPDQERSRTNARPIQADSQIVPFSSVHLTDEEIEKKRQDVMNRLSQNISQSNMNSNEPSTNQSTIERTRQSPTDRIRDESPFSPISSTITLPETQRQSHSTTEAPIISEEISNKLDSALQRTLLHQSMSTPSSGTHNTTNAKDLTRSVD